MQAREANIDLQIVSRLPPASPLLRLHADQGKMAQVIRNLVSNAVKFTRPGGSVSVTLAVDNPAWCAPDLEMALPSEERSRWFPGGRSSSSCGGGGTYALRSPKTYSESFLVPQCLVITVEDSGIGISAVRDGAMSFQRDIFKCYY